MMDVGREASGCAGREVFVSWWVLGLAGVAVFGAVFFAGRVTAPSHEDSVGAAWLACLDNSGPYIGATVEDTFALMGQCVDDYMEMGGSARVVEDSPSWDCVTMGNRVCGPRG